MITAILNIKGGCSKTLSAEMLARGYAKEGRKTLVVDADGQGDITASLMPKINFDQPENVVGGETPPKERRDEWKIKSWKRE